ncbi:aldehyde dehydrogenase family protein [Natronorubrum daqingense]|uniref:Aldehyde dehydrogenase n=1 Tax=Natronorubrum daqingense TaxID=588898 RepID=A0A1N7D138_9EURY|nr:aldehyde dehydrogenase family protein [Natronorubrum daqingense]APX97158.1 aldehyde dehydrogenase [Natronorubrum daqingense]SIR69638.1 aldehyde dehydrogenase (NAD+) [Natronorubrum daqingense]
MTDLPLAPETGWNALYLAGEWTEPDDRETITVENPFTREEIATVPAGTEDDVDQAYERAAAAQREWADQPPQARAGVITAALEFVQDHREEITELLALESGSTQVKCGAELQTATGMMQQAASYPFRMDGSHKGSTIPGKENVVERQPAGVVGVISPWNFPLHLSMRAVAPALATGNAVVLKPASNTPISGGLLLARIFEEAGVPEGVLSVVTGRGSAVGDAVSDHDVPRVLAFTGSTEIGQHVAANAAGNCALPALELGGNNVHVVTENADLERAVDGGVFGSFLHQGQACISINRHLVHEDVYDEYVDALADRAASLPSGDPTDEETVIGPIIDESQRDQILEYVEETVDEGATLETGGGAANIDEVADSLVVEPTVLSEADNDMAAACNEHFGPVAPAIPYSSDEEAIELANETIHGLSGSVHSEDLAQARRIADGIETGMIHINDQPINDEPHVPFGGMKQSGLGRYNADSILEELTTTKWISIQRESREYPF